MPRLVDLLPEVILASQSSARKALLEEQGIAVVVEATHCDERQGNEDPRDLTALLARRKMEAYLALHPDPTLPVLCCDTLVCLDGKPIGKARDVTEANRQLTRLSGREHLVHSGWILRQEGRYLYDVDTAHVRFRDLDGEVRRTYLATGEWKGAAGSYRIQGAGKNLVEHLTGDIATVVGLPILQISAILGSNCAR